MDFNNLKEKITKKHIIIGTSAIVLIAGAITAGVALSGDSDKENTGSNLVAEVTEATTTTTAVTTTTAPQTTTKVTTTTTVTTTAEPKATTKKVEEKEESSYVEEEYYEEDYYEEPVQEPANEEQYVEPEPEYVPEPEPAENYYYGQIFETGFQPAGCSYFCGVWVLNSQTNNWDFVPLFSDDDATAWVISTGYGKPSVNYDDGSNSISGYVWLN